MLEGSRFIALTAVARNLISNLMFNFKKHALLLEGGRDCRE